MPSPALSISSIVRPQSSIFAGQSPAPTYRSLPSFNAGFPSTRGALESHQSTEIGFLPQRYKQADEERLQGQLSVAQTSLGYSHHETLRILYELGCVLFQQGRYKSAEGVTRRLVVSRRNLAGDDDFDTLEAVNLLGHILEYQGLYIRALKHTRQCW
jgi:hypothetical protein